MRSRVVLVVVVVVALVAVVGALALLTLSKSAAPPPAPAMEAAPASRESLKDAAPPGAPAMANEAPAKNKARPGPRPVPAVVEKNGVKRVSCGFACAREDSCGFRDADDCEVASCDADDDADHRVRKASRSDFCFVDADDCAKAAACTCEEACWKRNECAHDHSNDAECTAACLTLMKQHPSERYREDRCILERGCGAIAACGAANTASP